MNGAEQLIGEFSMPDGERLIVKTMLWFDPLSQLASGVQTYARHRSDGELVDQRTLDINFYLFRKDEFEALATEAGFMVEALYGDYHYASFQEASSPYMIWKLKKKD